MNVFHAYRRVSDEKQVDNNSLDTQDATLRKYHSFKYPTFTYLDYCDPAISAVIPWFERKAGESLWTQLSAGDVIAVSMFDRAFRSLKDLVNTLEKLEERKVVLHALDLPVDVGTIEGQAFLQVVGVFKELERKTTSKRVKAVNQWKRENGLHVGSHRILGYKSNRKRGADFAWIPWKEEREFGQVVVLMHESDGLSFESVYLRVEAMQAKGQIQFKRPEGKRESKLTYGYLQRLYYAAKAGFKLPDGRYIPATAAEYVEWRKTNEVA